MIASLNPATGETLATFAELTGGEVEAALARSASAAAQWRHTPIAERARVLLGAARILEDDKSHFGRVMTLEMGKTFASAVAEAEKCALACRYYADRIEQFVAPEVIVEGSGERGEVRYEPLGTVLAVMPWNFPFWQVVRFAAPALAAGNVALLKHASNVPQCALSLEQVFLRAGAPPGVFQTLLVGSSRVDQLIADPRVHAVTLTGSEPAGRAVAATAGQHLKKTVLELGGSDPFVILASADVARAADVAVTARAINNGQSCIAAKRFIAVDAVGAEFTERFVAGMKALRVGDPMQEATQLGPLATGSIRDELDKQVQTSVSRGARVLTGGHIMDGPGNYYQPTVLGDVPRDSPAFSEELFGPVASLFVVPGVEAAIDLANATSFGLAASIWTRDAQEAELLAQRLETGSVFVNAMVASDPRYPFGGMKSSGYGRELGLWGLREFVNVKTVRKFQLTD